MDTKRKRNEERNLPSSEFVEGSALPSEVLLLLFSYMDTNSLISCGAVSKLWREVSEDNELWMHRFSQASLINVSEYNAELNLLKGSWKRLYVQELLCSGYGDIKFRDVVIYRRPPSECTHDFSRLRKLWGIHNRNLGLHGELPHYMRQNEGLIQLVREEDEFAEEFGVITIPSNINYRIKYSQRLRSEYIEEKHRTWKANYQSIEKKSRNEISTRQRRIIIDVGGEPGLHLTEEAIHRLEKLSGCYRRDHLMRIPRDHPALIRLYFEMQGSMGENVKMITIPIECRWFVGVKSGVECIIESYHRWPTIHPTEIRDFPFAKLEGNSVVSSMMPRDVWESHTEFFGLDEEIDFGDFTAGIEKDWQNSKHLKNKVM
eukprot:TRINITY_DN11016_c0_g1_i1.p1 TRINITY_DN11016_c0_g1~~TRINITY_DN11016_c0_g1_i1.p1  ORF type:complete len:374 (-),score=57.22 TRINITY_DN11016_c0_g1_i1:107-1228(-)